jgi:hypothetical protein
VDQIKLEHAARALEYRNQALEESKEQSQVMTHQWETVKKSKSFLLAAKLQLAELITVMTNEILYRAKTEQYVEELQQSLKIKEEEREAGINPSHSKVEYTVKQLNDGIVAYKDKIKQAKRSYRAHDESKAQLEAQIEAEAKRLKSLGDASTLPPILQMSPEEISEELDQIAASASPHGKAPEHRGEAIEDGSSRGLSRSPKKKSVALEPAVVSSIGGEHTSHIRAESVATSHESVVTDPFAF